MRWYQRVATWLGLRDRVVVKGGRARRACPVCGKRLAVVRATGNVWRHRCTGG